MRKLLTLTCAASLSLLSGCAKQNAAEGVDLSRPAYTTADLPDDVV